MHAMVNTWACSKRLESTTCQLKGKLRLVWHTLLIVTVTHKVLGITFKQLVGTNKYKQLKGLSHLMAQSFLLGRI